MRGAFVGQDMYSTMCYTAPLLPRRCSTLHRRSVMPSTQSSAQTMRRTYTGAKTAPPAVGGHHFLHIDDFSKEELVAMLSTARTVKDRLLRGDDYKPLAGKTMAMIFTKPSMRTRVSFETVSFSRTSDLSSCNALRCTACPAIRICERKRTIQPCHHVLGLLQTRRTCSILGSRHYSDWQARSYQRHSQSSQ